MCIRHRVGSQYAEFLGDFAQPIVKPWDRQKPSIMSVLIKPAETDKARLQGGSVIFKRIG
jgi:hypothetical protein